MKKSLIALLTACLLISCGTLTNAKTAEVKIMKEKVYYTQPKESLVIPNATHMEMYYKPEYVTQAVDKLTEFYGKYLGLNEWRDK